MTKNPIFNAVGAALYIALIVTLINSITRFAGPTETILIPMAMLSLFVLSVLVMGYFFIYQPLRLYLDGEKMSAATLFLKTIGSFAVITALFIIAMLVSAGGKYSSYKDISYIIDGETVLLKDGVAETEVAPGSASKITTHFFGNEAKGDLNSDGIPDLAFLLSRDGSGSGTFYYIVAALQTEKGGYQGTNAILLGDRIAPQTTEIRNGEVIVNYSDRRSGEAMTVKPSVGVSKYLRVSGNTLLESR
ncbi:MAG: hypothetical protein AAB518_03015 [Patescibacteria group bacterium]